MNNNRQQILLWGIKILAERYWGIAFNRDDIDKSVISKTLLLMPDSEILINQYDAGYKIDGENMYALQSIFNRVELFDGHTDDRKYYLQPSFDFEQLNLPVENEIIEPDIFKPENFDQFIIDSDPELLINILQKYGGFLPILNQKNCAMPIFEYVKIAAALSENPQGDFRFVIGDLSGIQDFIYTISSENALKVLRARSFYLELLIKSLAYNICDDLQLSSASIFYAGGGSFLLLLPEKDNLDEKLDTYYTAVNKYFLMQFQGNIHMPFASTKIAHTDLLIKDSNIIQDCWNRLFSVELSKAKNKKFHSLFTSEDKSNSLINTLGKPEEVDGRSCAICRKDTYNINLKNDICDFCARLKEIGAKLYKLPEIKAIKMKPNNFTIPDPQKHKLWPFAPDTEKDSRVFNINSIDHNEKPLMFYGNYNTTKKDKNNNDVTAEFKDMAGKAIGANRIASLAMDVDNMSAIFREGIKVVDPRQFLVCAPTLSRMLDYFFKLGITRICENPKYRVVDKLNKDLPRQLSIIYSGGDDLLLAGAWNDVAEIAIDIQENFQKFTCFNPDMGISGGMYVSSDSFPFYISVSKAKEAESNYAKKNYDEQTKCNLHKKNSIVFFYDELSSFIASKLSDESFKDRYLFALKWEEVNNAIRTGLSEFLGKKLITMDNGKINVKYSRNFIGKLYDIHQKYLKNREGEIYLPDFVYYYARMDRNIRPLMDHFIEEKYLRYDQKKLDNPIRYLPVILNWLELLLREKGE